MPGRTRTPARGIRQSGHACRCCGAEATAGGAPGFRRCREGREDFPWRAELTAGSIFACEFVAERLEVICRGGASGSWSIAPLLRLDARQHFRDGSDDLLELYRLLEPLDVVEPLGDHLLVIAGDEHEGDADIHEGIGQAE